MKPLVGKRRTREHIIADLSMCFVEWQALRCGYTVERVYRDYGIDLEVNTFNTAGEMEPVGFYLQVKATDGLALVPGKATLPLRIERKHLVHWLKKPMPVILVLFDAKKSRGYWLYVQQYFQRLKDFNLFAAGETITVRIPVVNRVNPRAMRKFARFRDRIGDQMGEFTHE